MSDNHFIISEVDLNRIVIIGLGLIGGSLGLALKKARGDDVEVIGFSRRAQTVTKARERGIIDTPAFDLAVAVAQADIIVIATPVLKIKETLKIIAAHVPQECTITDVGSTKRDVMRWADAYLPDGVNYIGGHPMAGKEISGLDAATADLFEGCIYCLIPSSGASREATEELTRLVEDIGAVPLSIAADLHDSAVAGVSHLPVLLAASLVAATANTSQWSSMAKLAASGYRDISRLASGDPEMNRDICLTNRDEIASWIDRYIEELKGFRELVIEGDSQGLMRALESAREARGKWLHEGGL